MKVPQTWTEVSISAIADVLGGGTPDRGTARFFGGSMPWATPSDVTQLSSLAITSTSESLTDEGVRSSSARVLPAGAVLLTSRATIGRTAIAAQEMTTNQGFVNLVCDHEIVCNEYLARLLQAMTPILEARAGGSTFKEISRTAVGKLRVPLPTLPEQRRIAEILGIAESLRPHGEDINCIRGSVLHALLDSVISGADVRSARLSDLVDMRYGSSEPSGTTDTEGLPILRIPNVIGGVVNTGDLKYVQLPAAEAERLRLRAGDILIVRSNGNPEYVGRCAPLPIWIEKTTWVYASYLIRLRPKTDAIRPEYLSAFLNSPYGRAAMRNTIRTTAGQSNLNTESLSKIRVPLPSKATQSFFTKLWEEVNEVTQRIGAARVQADQLFNALQYQAFDGTLTEKWRGENLALVQEAARARDAKLRAVGHRLSGPVSEREQESRPSSQPHAWIHETLSHLQRTVLQALNEPVNSGAPFIADDPDQMAEFINRTPFEARLPSEAPTPAEVRSTLEQLAALGLIQKISLRLQPVGSNQRSLRFVSAYTLPINTASLPQIMLDLGLGNGLDESGLDEGGNAEK